MSTSIFHGNATLLTYYWVVAPSPLERHDTIPERPTGIAPPHSAERLEESNAVSPLTERESPQRRILDQRPRDVPVAIR